MDKIERLETVYDYIAERKKVSIKELSSKFAVSEVTTRKDLQEPETRGLIIKSYGYARLKTSDLLLEPDYVDKVKSNADIKNMIAMKAADLIMDHDVIFLSTGSTINSLCGFIHKNKSLTVITNDLKNAYILALYPNIQLILASGCCRAGTYSMIGASTYKFLSGFNVTKAFISCSAFSAKNGVFTTIPDSAVINRIMIQNAQKVYLVADSTKYNKYSMIQIAPTTSIDYLITDKYFPVEDIGKFQSHETEVIIAE